MASGTDDNLTLQANVTAYKNIQLRPRRLVDVSKIDTGVELFGQRFASPTSCAPVGGHRMFHTDGEVATARAAKARNALQLLSTQTSIRVEDVAAARGGGLWYQLTRRQRGTTPRRWSGAWKRPAARCWCGPSTCLADATSRRPRDSG